MKNWQLPENAGYGRIKEAMKDSRADALKHDVDFQANIKLGRIQGMNEVKAMIMTRKDWLEQFKTTPDDNGQLPDEKECQHQIDCCNELLSQLGSEKPKTNSKGRTEEELNREAVLKAHNIEVEEDGTFLCDDGDGFDNIWKALEHTIWLDLLSCEGKPKTYHNFINQLDNMGKTYEDTRNR